MAMTEDERHQIRESLTEVHGRASRNDSDEVDTCDPLA